MNKKISTLVACLLMVLPPAVPAEILWTHTKPQLNATHIYIGEINGYGKPSGFHARFNGQVPENIRILGITSQPNKAGVYMAQIAIDRATQQQDYTEIDRQFKLLQTPFHEHPDMAHYAAPPPDWARNIQVSCSS